MYNASLPTWRPDEPARRAAATARRRRGPARGLAAWLLGALLLGRPVQAAPAPAHEAAPQRRVDRVVAVVDRDIITEYELEQKAEGHLESLLEMPAGAERDAARRQALRKVLEAEIGERLLTREVAANKDKLGVSEKDIDKAIDEVLNINHIDRDQLQTALYGQGLTMSEYRGKLRAQIERARLLQFKVQGRIHIKESDVQRRCLERERLGQQHVAICAGHVLLQITSQMPADRRKALRKEAEHIRAELLAGASLAAMAEKYSDDTSAKDGNLGCFHRGEMVEAFEHAAFALPDGGISEVVESPFGLHVIKVFHRRADSAGSCTSAAALEGIKNELFQQEMARQLEVWLGELRHAAFVDVRL